MNGTYVCFHCRKGFKEFVPTVFTHRRDKKCPDCGRIMACLGKNFKTPRKLDSDGWKSAWKLWKSGHFWPYGEGEPRPIVPDQEDIYD